MRVVTSSEWSLNKSGRMSKFDCIFTQNIQGIIRNDKMFAIKLYFYPKFEGHEEIFDNAES